MGKLATENRPEGLRFHPRQSRRMGAAASARRGSGIYFDFAVGFLRCDRAFAGPEYEKAVYYPEDERYLLQLDLHVTHYEVLSGPAGAAGSYSHRQLWSKRSTHFPS